MNIGAITLIALGGALAIEGAAWAIFPGGLRRLYLDMVSEMGERDLHVSGLISVFIGMVLLFLGVNLLS
ncbi:hypothetical protein DES40_1000 [Litorimonas taeanensis]|uniref:DUF2065 domain-containing protein n=1 Tax=Litorimonas taeanensis TaxID=568099 RepID=A0A420WKX2_9PROT|nr:DUF2065 domain-containing protein [Litorimonas taeanensis]RKQ71673.1 hypothetical protein DES40_1000 [Litorimonas taeanensis]